MNKGLKRILAVVIDVIFVGIIAFAVWGIIANDSIHIKKNLLSAIIVVLIPIGFFVTYMSFEKEIDFSKIPGEDEEEQEEQEQECVRKE